MNANELKKLVIEKLKVYYDRNIEKIVMKGFYLSADIEILENFLNEEN